MRRPALVLCAAAVVVPGVARGDGLPVGNVEVGPQGVVVPGASDRIVALPAGDGATLVARIEREGGRVEDVLRLRDRFTVPGVALDGTADGRSADGRTAVLIHPRGDRFPLRRTRLVVLGVRPLAVRRRLVLRGDFSFDALSPDGRRMYLVNYVHPRDPSRYVVRSYDLRRGRFDPGAIVDTRDPAVEMRGYPVTRLTTPGGRWAYTLYDGGGVEPFIHALDTVERRALCIDLPMLEGIRNAFELRLRAVAGRLEVVDGESTRAVVDMATMHAHEPVVLAARVTRPPASGPDWALTGLLAALGLLGALSVARWRRGAPRGAGSDGGV